MTKPSFYIVPECEGPRYPIRHRPVIQGYGDWPFRRAEELGDASDEARAAHEPSRNLRSVSAPRVGIAIAGAGK